MSHSILSVQKEKVILINAFLFYSDWRLFVNINFV